MIKTRDKLIEQIIHDNCVMAQSIKIAQSPEKLMLGTRDTEIIRLKALIEVKAEQKKYFQVELTRARTTAKKLRAELHGKQ